MNSIERLEHVSSAREKPGMKTSECFIFQQSATETRHMSSDSLCWRWQVTANEASSSLRPPNTREAQSVCDGHTNTQQPEPPDETPTHR